MTAYLCFLYVNSLPPHRILSALYECYRVVVRNIRIDLGWVFRDSEAPPPHRSELFQAIWCALLSTKSRVVLKGDACKPAP